MSFVILDEITKTYKMGEVEIHAVDQNSGLAAACTGQNEQRAVGGKYRLPLHIVQAAKLLFNIGIAQSAEFLLETCCHCFTCSSIKSLTL